MKRIPFIVLAFAFAFAAAAVGATSASAQIVDSVARKALAQRVDSGKNAAIVLGILEAGRTRIISVGTSGAPSGTLDGNTVFEIGSLTKVFTSTVLADMVRRGHVALEDPVAEYLPAEVRVPERNGKQITLADLAMQQSGLPRLPTNLHPANARNPYADYTVEQMYDFLAHYELTRDVGAQYEYSNLGVGLLGHAMARRAGIDYEGLLRQRLLAPLSMEDTRIALGESQRQRLAQGHLQTGAPADNWDVPTLAAAGALRSTANDMLKFARAAMSDAGPLGGAFADAERPRRAVAPLMQIGLNWFTATTLAGPIIWHDGGTGGYASFLGLDKQRQRAIVLLTNSATPVADLGVQLLVAAAGSTK